MAVAVARPSKSRVVPKQWYLSKTETINTFNNWKENQIYCLSLDDDFKPYLADGVTWNKKTAADPYHGLTDDADTVDNGQTRQTKSAILELMLGQIANWATVISRHQITKNSTSLTNVWDQIRAHYGFLGTGARFLDLTNIKLEVVERPEDLYQRLFAFFEDNLLTSGSSVTHHGVTSTSDEEVTPTVENTIVFLWLEKVHIGLPGLVKQRYGTELRNKTISSLKSEISLAMSSLLDELRTTESTSVLRVQNFRGRQQQGRFSAHRGGNRPTSTSRSNRYCCLCRTANRPDFESHYLAQCRYLPESDRRRMSSSVRNVEVVDVFANEYDSSDVENMYLDEFTYDEPEQFHDDHLYDTYVETEDAGTSEGTDIDVVDVSVTQPSVTSLSTPSPHVATPPPITRRVMVRKSPFLSCFYQHLPVLVCLDCGAESNLISLECVKKLQLTAMKGNQGALQADSKTPLTVLGEVKNVEIHRGAHTLIFEGLVIKEEIGEIVGGEPFLEINDIAIRSSKKEIRIRDSDPISYANDQQ